MTDEERRDKRYPAQQELLVRCESWGEFAELYAADVSRGGMFILTERPLPLLSEVEVSLRLPEGHEMQLKATVVHVMDSEQAARENKRAGIGVQFNGIDAVRRQQIRQLTEFARESSETGAATSATYASRLFETMASMPPSKVLEALPPRPSSDPRSGASHMPPRQSQRSSGQPSARTSQRAVATSQAPNGNSDRASARRTGERSLMPAARRTGEQLLPAAVSSLPPATRQRPDATGTQPTQLEEDAAGSEGAAAAPPAGPPTAPDPQKLKLAMTHFAHRRWDQAIRAFEELVAETGGDLQARHWMHMSRARLHLKNRDADAAAEHYKKALESDESNHEARKFVREHSAKKRLSALPFGRYFVKKG